LDHVAAPVRARHPVHAELARQLALHRGRRDRLRRAEDRARSSCPARAGARIDLPVHRIVRLAFDDLAGGEAEGLGAGPPPPAGRFAGLGGVNVVPPPAGAAGLARAGDPAAGRAAPALIGAAGAGLIGAAVFTTDPVSGYPPGTPDALTRPTRTGIAHNLAAVPVFAGLPAAALAGGWRSWRAGQRRFGLYGAATAVTMLSAMALAGAGFGQSARLINLGGMFQRASIITGFAWLTALSAHALRTPATAAPCHQAG
jgi:hypothetical protein